MIQVMCPDCRTVFDVEDPGNGDINQTHLVCQREVVHAGQELPMKELAVCEEDLFWYYIQERHRIYERRTEGLPKPWSQDPIFQQFKFVNVFRRLDRTTKWLIDNFLEPNDDPTLLMFNICWFRMFSRIDTGAAMGWQTEWNPQKAGAILNCLSTPFTGAYIIHSEPGYGKVDSINIVCEDLYLRRHEIMHVINETQSMEKTWKFLQHSRHVGPFMAYQMVLDMMYTPLLQDAHDRYTWTCTGPGAMRGLRRLDPEATMSDSLGRMQRLQARSHHLLEGVVPAMDIHDIEYCLCELDKYCRVKFGEGRPRSTYPGVK